MSKVHNYTARIHWTDENNNGTTNYTAYSRNHIISFPFKPDLPSSSEPAFRGDKTRYNPEEMLLASISSCHLLWYLHICTSNGIVLVEYEDNAEGVMEVFDDGIGKFTSITLHPKLKITDESKLELAKSLHEEAHKFCFISNSVNFPIKIVPK